MRDIDVQRLLAVFVPTTFIIFVGLWMYFPPGVLNDKTAGLLNTLLGLHGGWAAMIIGYYFNSSSSSARKDEIIAQSVPPPNGAKTP